MNPTYNTLANAHKLQDAGFQQPQAEAVVESINNAINTVATKADLAVVVERIEKHIERQKVHMMMWGAALTAIIVAVVVKG